MQPADEQLSQNGHLGEAAARRRPTPSPAATRVPFAISDSFRFTRLQDYALMFSWNPYLDVFGRNLSVGLADTGTAESRARRALLRPDMLVIFTEELPKGGLDVLWRSLNETHPPKLRQMLPNEHGAA